MCSQRETTASENWQKFSKLFPFWYYCGSCGIETFMTFSNEVTEVTKRPDFFDFFTIDINRVSVWDGRICYFFSTLLTFKISVRFQKTLEEVWIGFVPSKATNKAFGRVEPNIFIAHTLRNFTCFNWFRGILYTYRDLCFTNIYTQAISFF